MMWQRNIKKIKKLVRKALLGLRKMDRGLGILLAGLWTLFLLRHFFPQAEGFWSAAILLLLVGSAALTKKTSSIPVVTSLLIQRILMVAFQGQGLIPGTGEFLLQLAAAVGARFINHLSKLQQSLNDKKRSVILEDAVSNLLPKVIEAKHARLCIEDPFVLSRRSSETLVELLKTSLGCHTVVFAWAGKDQKEFTVDAWATEDPDQISRDTFSIHQGRFSTLSKSDRALILRTADDDTSWIPYYKTQKNRMPRISVVMAVPVYANQQLIGVFFLDRKEGVPFYQPDTASAERARTIISDFASLSRELVKASKTITHLSRLNEAATRFNQATTIEEVYSTIVTTAVNLTSFRHSILSHRMPGEKMFEVVAVTEPAFKDLLGSKHTSRDGLCAYAKKLGAPFPPLRSNGHVAIAPPFGKDVGLELEDGEAHQMVPLLAQDRLVGFLLMAGGAMPSTSQFELLKLLANLAATSLVNAENNYQLRTLATTDPLTSLANKRAFNQKAKEVMDRFERRGEPFSLLFLDLDHFKKINDTRGHKVGDEVLVKMAEVIQAEIRKVDLAARYGGEEFTVLLEATSKNAALTISERIRASMEKADFTRLGIRDKVTVSVGIASVPDDCRTIDSLMEMADQALYQAKRSGRNRCCAAA